MTSADFRKIQTQCACGDGQIVAANRCRECIEIAFEMKREPAPAAIETTESRAYNDVIKTSILLILADLSVNRNEV